MLNNITCQDLTSDTLLVDFESLHADDKAGDDTSDTGSDAVQRRRGFFEEQIGAEQYLHDRGGSCRANMDVDAD